MEECHCNHICWGSHQVHAKKHTLEVKNLSFSYRATEALREVNFSTTCGRSIALIGPNGAGKSTLLKALAGLLPRHTGEIVWKGEVLKMACQEIAYLPQHSQVDWSFPLTVRGVVEMGRYPSVGLFGRFSQHDKEMIKRALETLRLSELADRQIGSLSGGQQQRVFLARALAQEAHVLLLDEPFTGLDKPSADSLSELIRLFTNEGRLVMASHHDLASVESIFDQALLLNKTVLAFGNVKNVLKPEIIEQTFGKI